MANLNPTPIERFRVFDFSGGLNNHDQHAAVGENELTFVNNLTFDEDGKIKKRPGLKVSNLPSRPERSIRHMARFTKESGESELLIFIGDGSVINDRNQTIVLQKEDGSPYGSFLGTTFSSFSYGTNFYFMNATDGAFKYDGTTLVAKRVPAIPKVDFCVVKDNRAFYAGEKEKRDFVYVSHVGNPEDISMVVEEGDNVSIGGAGTFFKIVTSNDVPITGLTVFQNAVMVFKPDSVHTIAGDSTSNFSVRQVNVKTGTLSPKSIVRANNAVYYLGSDKSVYSINSPFQDHVANTPVSAKITPHIKGIVIPEQVTAVYFENQYWLCYYDATDAKTLIYDETKAVWTKWDLDLRTIVHDESMKNLYVAGRLFKTNTDYTGYIYTLEDNKRKDEVKPNVFKPIDGSFITPHYYLGKPESDKKFKWLKVFYTPQSVRDASIDVLMHINALTRTRAIDTEFFTLVWGDGKWGDNFGKFHTELTKLIRFGGSGNTIQLEFRNNRLDEDLDIHGFVLGFKTRKKVR